MLKTNYWLQQTKAKPLQTSGAGGGFPARGRYTGQAKNSLAVIEAPALLVRGPDLEYLRRLAAGGGEDCQAKPRGWDCLEVMDPVPLVAAPHQEEGALLFPLGVARSYNHRSRTRPPA